jgi:hypothetical protein
LASLDACRARRPPVSAAGRFQESLDRLARIVEDSLDMEVLERIIRKPV